MDFTVVLQGYSMSPEQMEEVVKYYLSLGLRNIVVSSYSSCINDFVRKNAVCIEHDIADGNFEQVAVNTYKDKYVHKSKGNGSNLIIKSDEKIPNIKSRNLNNHLYTSRTGLIKGQQMFNSKYSLKCRADMVIYDLDKILPTWIEQITTDAPHNEIFDLRVLQLGFNKREDWYIYDFFAFSTTTDLINYYSIPYGNDSTPENYKKAKSAESYISSGRILSMESGSYEFLRNKYFCFSPKTNGYWYKRESYLKNIKL